ncbi:MAG TPA: adenylate kinase [Actinomycetota bacterium]|nr:adenylate kinase [Actinomycetota bacterium]
MRLVLLGPPGAGKGTQAARLAERHGWRHIASGDLFRRHVQEGTELGTQVRSYLDRGELVPDELTVRMVMEEVARSPAGFVLDGFPRTLPQAEALERELAAAGRPLSLALAFVLDEEAAVARIAGRRTCARCQRVYNVVFAPPRVEGRCDACGGELVQRSDEDEPTVRRRLAVYREQTLPLLGFYGGRGLLREVDAGGTEEEVAAKVEAILQEAGGGDP